MSDGINYVPAPDGYVLNEYGQYVPAAAVVDGEALDTNDGLPIAEAADAVHAADALAGE